jgi:hypothetical protein
MLLCSAWQLHAADTFRASSEQPGFPAQGAMDGDRFALDNRHAWVGAAGTSNWWWQAEFAPPRPVGAILQVVGDHEFVLRNAPRSYVWEGSDDGAQWRPLGGASQVDERRIYRLHRLARPESVRFIRLSIQAAHGDFPVVREVEFSPDPNAVVPFPEWIVAVNVTHDSALPGEGKEFAPLAKSCAGWESLQAQQIWLTDFHDAFLAAEPRPLCGFLSGSFRDWCEVDREHWRGVQEVLRGQRLPIWASCGGAQGLAIVSEYGVDQPWDCPHCRDPIRPKTPLYTHIGHKPGPLVCGQYDRCVFERGPMAIRTLRPDPVFAGLPEDFTAMQSHCGQIEWTPKGWELIATAGPGGLTRTQCLRFEDRPIYAAQFHIEMSGTPDVSRRIMGNFLGLAKSSGGYPLADTGTRAAAKPEPLAPGSVRPKEPAVQAVARGREFLLGLIHPELHLLPEFKGHHVIWLYHDNYLAAKVLAATHPVEAARITAAIRSYGVGHSGKIELLFGESELPFRHYELRDVAIEGGFTIRSEFTTDAVNPHFTQYADLQCFAAIAEPDAAKARAHFDAALAMWDGTGFTDPATRVMKRFATYKLALALLAARRVGDHSPALAVMRERLLKMQADSGGWITDYRPDGTPVGMANVETTCLAILALEAPAKAAP